MTGQSDMDLKVFITTQESTCSECKSNLGRHAWVLLAGERGAIYFFCPRAMHFNESGGAATFVDNKVQDIFFSFPNKTLIRRI